MDNPSPHDAVSAPSVSDLVVELLTRIESDPASRETVVEELCARWPDQDQGLRAAVANLDSAGLIGMDELPESIGEFRPIRRIAGGGMGVVLLAEQPALGRRVALKLLRADELLRDGAKARFQRETEAVARLAHPNVVTVHSLGREAGVPFLAMDYVEGTSLDRILAAQSGRDPSKLTGDDFFTAITADMAGRGEAVEDDALKATQDQRSSTWIETVLRMVRDIAGALAHAHANDVLHRDVKPSNIMVTPAGRVLLVDFGLAAVLDSERLTRSGAQMGSLPYMPPETLAGDAEPDPRSDVYSLGVTLYELLLLELPFPGRGTKRLQKDIEAGQFIAARSLNSAVNSDLETVLRCACDHDKNRRYASASAFAADLTNLLEKRPIAARPASAWLRTVRWVQRRPEQAGLAALAGLLLVVGPTTFGLMQKTHAAELTKVNAQLTSSLAAETEERKRADAHFWRATAAIDQVMTRIAGEGLEDEPRMQKARLEAIESALGILDGLRAERPEHPQVLQTWGTLLMLSGDLQRELGHPQTAIETLSRYTPVAERLMELEPDEVQHRYNWALGQRKLALAMEEHGQQTEALDMLYRPSEVIEECHQSDPTNLLWRRGLSLVTHQMAYLMIRLREFDEAGELVAKAVPFARTNAEANPQDEKCLGALTYALRAEGSLRVALTDWDGAIESFQEAISTAEQVLELIPGDSHFQTILTEVSIKLTTTLMRQQRTEEASPALARALDVSRQLRGRFPSVRRHADREVELLSLSSWVESDSGNEVLGVELGQEALDLRLKLRASTEREQNVVGQLNLAVAHGNLASRIVMAKDLGEERFDRAEMQARESLRLAEDSDPHRGRRVIQQANYVLAQLFALSDREVQATAAVHDLAEVSLNNGLEQYFLGDAWAEVFATRVRTGSSKAEQLQAKDAALGALESAVEAGYRERAILEESEVLQAFADDPRFKAILERAGTRQ